MQKLLVEFKNTSGNAPQVPCSVSWSINQRRKSQCALHPRFDRLTQTSYLHHLMFCYLSFSQIRFSYSKHQKAEIPQNSTKNLTVYSERN